MNKFRERKYNHFNSSALCSSMYSVTQLNELKLSYCSAGDRFFLCNSMLATKGYNIVKQLMPICR